jgi:hypothetical protein
MAAKGRPLLMDLPTPNLCACACVKNGHAAICTHLGTEPAWSDSILLMCEPCANENATPDSSTQVTTTGRSPE